MRKYVYMYEYMFYSYFNAEQSEGRVHLAPLPNLRVLLLTFASTKVCRFSRTPAASLYSKLHELHDDAAVERQTGHHVQTVHKRAYE